MPRAAVHAQLGLNHGKMFVELSEKLGCKAIVVERQHKLFKVGGRST
ncbi:MAG: hypothetical protein R3D34_04960 [Nitratireductor sp.]